MRTNTLVTLGASAVFGVMAIVLARGWINDALENEFRQAPMPIAEPTNPVLPEAVPMASVVVADVDLAFGDRLTPDVLRIVELPEASLPDSIFRDFQDLFSPESDLMGSGAFVVLDEIRRNEVIVPHRISGFNGAGSLSSRIRPGYRAVSVQVTDITGVAGFIIPGDLVDVQYVSISNSDGGEPVFRSDVLLQSVRVLGTDQSFDEQRNSVEIASTVTLEVSHMDAQKLALAQEKGSLSLSLRAVGETAPSTTRTLDSRELVSSVKTKQLTATSKKITKVTPKETPPPVAEILVIRGEETQSVSVQREPVAEPSTLDLAGG